MNTSTPVWILSREQIYCSRCGFEVEVPLLYDPAKGDFSKEKAAQVRCACLRCDKLISRRPTPDVSQRKELLDQARKLVQEIKNFTSNERKQRVHIGMNQYVRAQMKCVKCTKTWSSQVVWGCVRVTDMHIMRVWEQGCVECSTMQKPKLTFAEKTRLIYKAVRKYAQVLAGEVPSVPRNNRDIHGHIEELCEKCEERGRCCYKAINSARNQAPPAAAGIESAPDNEKTKRKRRRQRRKARSAAQTA